MLVKNIRNIGFRCKFLRLFENIKEKYILSN